MWILENDGDALNGKKLWLRPGKKFLFGRTKYEDGDFVVDNKTISRKHLTVEVEEIEPGACENAQSRTKLTLTDLGTKIGTLVNGEQIRGKSLILQNDVNTVQLGKYEQHFRFTCVPVTLSFSFTTRESKADPYTPLHNLLGPLDIKVLTEYEVGYTTHLLAKKRNTSRGLQALINGKYIVHNDTFIKALVAAATPSEEDGPAPLEEDFEANFPDPLKYLPPRGEEPTTRADEAYAPNANRRNMFEGYTFVFYEQRQYETLLAPITDGRGKALLREAIPEQTTVDDFIRYVKGVAGEKGLGEFEDGSEGKGVVVVRFNPVKGAGTEWFKNFGREVSLHLDHRFVEQNEFLDSILGSDASVLRRPLLEASFATSALTASAPVRSSRTLRRSEPEPRPISTSATEEAAPPPTSATEEAAPPPTSTEMAPPDPPRRGRSRRTARPQFKGFDDDFTVPLSMSSIPEAESMQVNQPAVEESQSQGLFVTQNTQMELDRPPWPSSQEPETQTRSSRKRSAPPAFDEMDEEQEAERIAPAAAALKRRRLEEAADRRRRGVSTPPPEPKLAPVIKDKEQPVAKTAPKRRSKKQDIIDDVGEALNQARQKREEAEALAKAEREALQVQLEGMDISDIRKLVQVEDMEVKRSRPPPPRAERADESIRWEPEWNGRKNFKKFRHRPAKGESVMDSNSQKRPRVIVPLEEVKKREFGIGDDYWDEGGSQRKKKKDKGKSKETREVSQPDSRTSPGPKPKYPSAAAEKAARLLAAELSEDEGEDELAEPSRVEDSEIEIVPPPPKAKAVASRSQTLKDKTNKSRNLAKTAATGSRKRTAGTTLTKPAPAKKAKQAIIRQEESEDESDDDLKFSFKKRGRGV